MSGCGICGTHNGCRCPSPLADAFLAQIPLGKPTSKAAGAFSIGSACWPGLSKLIEECGETLQVCGKLIATGGEREHWDGSDLKARIEDEMADLLAATTFVTGMNGLDVTRMAARTREKIALFHKWHKEQGS